ncbi:MAG TPA: TolC family protein [Pyrinomonadaceae bacterium]|nr:TolC family protein [Pyrinomonadaceae bacterium]
MSKQLFLIIFTIFLTSFAVSAQTPQATPPAQPPTQPPAEAPQPRPDVPNQPTNPTQQPQPNLPAQPQTPNVTPSGTIPNPQTVIPASPTQDVGATGIAPAKLPDDPPPVAPNFQAPVRPLPSAERIGVDIANQLPMTLDEAIELALQNNNDIDTSKVDVQIAEFNLRAANGVYDPLIVSENYYESATIPTASTIGGAVNGAVTQRRFFSSGGVNGFSPWAGGFYSANFNSSRFTTSNTNATLNPQYPTALTLSYTQPLLRGRRFDLNRRNIEIAKKNLSLSDAQFRQRAIEVIAQVEQAYWNLVFSLRNLQVQIDAVRQARTQLESNQRLVEKGVLAPIDIVAATTQITTFEQSVYTAQEDVTRAENNLKTLMLPDRTSEVWSRPITPVSEVDLDPPRVGLEVSVAEALKNRPEITQLQTNAEINQINTRYYRDLTKPQIDLIGTYTSQGLAGTETGVRDVPSNLVGGYFNSLGNLAAQDYPTYRVGVQITLPWGNRVAEANLGSSLVQANRIQNQRAQTEQIIEAEVRNSLQALRSSEARLASALATRQSVEQLYESEQRRFSAGTTTLFLVLQRQTELLVARSRELQAQTDLNKAISEFQRATGTTLSANNVTISENTNLIKTNVRRTTFSSRIFTGGETK